MIEDFAKLEWKPIPVKTTSTFEENVGEIACLQGEVYPMNVLNSYIKEGEFFQIEKAIDNTNIPLNGLKFGDLAYSATKKDSYTMEDVLKSPVRIECKCSIFVAQVKDGYAKTEQDGFRDAPIMISQIINRANLEDADVTHYLGVFHNCDTNETRIKLFSSDSINNAVFSETFKQLQEVDPKYREKYHLRETLLAWDQKGKYTKDGNAHFLRLDVPCLGVDDAALTTLIKAVEPEAKIVDYRNSDLCTLLRKEINMISDKDLAEKVEKILKGCPVRHCWEPASSSGKYHPLADLGDGGLIRHTKTVVHVLNDLIRMKPFVTRDKDEMIAAAILHDMAKFEETGDHTVFEHPKVMADKCEEEGLFNVARMVASHMGQWNTSGRSKIVLETPQTDAQMTVHLADYIASRKYTVVEFDLNGEIVNA